MGAHLADRIRTDEKEVNLDRDRHPLVFALGNNQVKLHRSALPATAPPVQLAVGHGMTANTFCPEGEMT
jgi:hypothetical protein